MMIDGMTLTLLGLSIALNAVCIWLMTRREVEQPEAEMDYNQPVFTIPVRDPRDTGIVATLTTTGSR